MLLDRRPWTISALSETSGFSRAAVRKMLKQAVKSEWMKVEPGVGYSFTVGGAAAFDAIVSDLQDIYTRKLEGLSPQTVELIRKLPPFNSVRRKSLERAFKGVV